MNANLVYVDAIDRFLDKLEGVEEPEKKRKIIGARVYPCVQKARRWKASNSPTKEPSIRTSWK